jgi:IS1 family transposase
MNKLPISTRTQIVKMLVEGNSLRSITRMTGCSINTVTKLLVEVGQACSIFHYETVKNLSTRRAELDECWSYVGKKESHVSNPEKNDGLGSIWTWIAMDSDSKLVISWMVGERDADTAMYFVEDVAMRLKNKIQLTTDGLRAYINAVDAAFGNNIDFAQLVKVYGGVDGQTNERKYSPSPFVSAKKTPITGNPDPKNISTSYIERQNLTLRMGNRRFTRLTNAFSKKLENHCHSIALHFVYYNFCRIHQTLRVTPAMEAGLTSELMSVEEVVLLIDKYKNNH